MGNQSRVNTDSYHSTLSLSDKHDRMLSFGQQNFSAYTVGFLHLYRNFDSCRGSLTPMFQAFHLRGLTTSFLLRPTHINYFSFYDLNYESLLDVVPKTNSTHIHQRVVNNHTMHPHPTLRDATVHMNVMMSIHISNSDGLYTIIFHIIQTIMLTHQFSMH